MKTQTSRYHRPGYSGVYQQQGRMLTDADWNEMVETLKERLAEALAQVIGSGAPRENGLLLFPDADSPRNWTQHNVFRPSGLAIVDGIAARLPSAWTITARGPAAESDVTAFDALLLENGLRKDVRGGSYLEFEARRIQEEVHSLGGTATCEVLAAPNKFSSEWMYLNQATLPNAPPFPDTEAPTSLVARPAALEAARGTDEETDVSAAVAGTGETPPTVPQPEVTFQVYLDVWERTVTSLEDPSLADPALYGADTTTRSYVMAQLKLAPFLTRNPDDPSAYPSKGNLHLSAKLVTDATNTMDPCLTETAIDARHEAFLLRVEIHEATDASLTIKWSTENGAEAFLVRDAPDEFKEGPGSFEFFNEATEKSLGLHLVPGFSPPVGELLAEWPNQPPDGFPFVRRWDGYAKLTLPAGDIARESSSPASARVRVDSGKLLFLVGNAARVEVRIDLPDVARGKLAMRGDYWLIEVRDDAPSARRVTFSQSPLGVTHHYLPLFRVAGGTIEDFSTDDPERTAHFRRLRFPHFSQLNLDSVDGINTSIAEILRSISELDGRKVSKSGDWMTGALRMGASPGTTPNLEFTPTGDIKYSGSLSKLNVVVDPAAPLAQTVHARIEASDLWLGHAQRRGAPGRALVDHGQAGGMGLVINYRDQGDAGWNKVHIGGPLTVTDTAGADLLKWDEANGLWQHRQGTGPTSAMLPLGGISGSISFQDPNTITFQTGLGPISQCLVLYERNVHGQLVPPSGVTWSQDPITHALTITATKMCNVEWFAFAVRRSSAAATVVGTAPEISISPATAQVVYGDRGVAFTAMTIGTATGGVQWVVTGPSGYRATMAGFDFFFDTSVGASIGAGMYEVRATYGAQVAGPSGVTVKPFVKVTASKTTHKEEMTLNRKTTWVTILDHVDFEAEVKPTGVSIEWTVDGATSFERLSDSKIRVSAEDIVLSTDQSYEVKAKATATQNSVSNSGQRPVSGERSELPSQ